MINAGDVFITSDSQRHVDDHLWTVISDPSQNAERVLIANLTTYRGAPGHDDCVLGPEEYEGLDHKSCILFQKASVCSLEHLEKALEKGLIQARQSLSEDVLARIRAAAEETRFLSGEAKELLRQQTYLYGP